MASAVVYRQLLRCARELDRNPMGKALLIATPSELFDRRARSVVALPEVGGAASECAGLLGAFNSSSGGGGGQGAEYYAPSSSAVEAVRRARHTDFANHPLDVGLAALRTLSAAVQGGEALSQLQPQTAWPSLDTRVRLRVGTAPKTGSLLLTHPVSCLSQPSLHHAVILLVSVSEEHVVGVTINKPFGASPLHSPSAPTPLLGGAVDEARRDKLGPLCEASLHQGGDVSPSSLLALHSLGPLENSSAVSEGLWVTSELHELREAVEADAPHPPEADEGDASPGAKTEPPLLRLKCLVGHAGWAYEQLEAELRRNVWFLLEPEEGTSLAPLALRQPPAALPEGGPSSSAWLRDALWEGVVERAGGAMLEMQGFPGDHAAVRAVARETEALQRELLRKRIDLLVPSEGAKE